MTDDDERAAREWLDGAENDIRSGADFRRAKYTVSDNWKHRATILRLLDRPALPRPGEIPLEVLDAMFNAAAENPPDSSIPDMAAAYAVLHARLTAPPKPKRYELLAFFRQDDTHPFCTGHDIKYMNNMLDRWPGGRIIKLIEAADDDQ